jgi:hypothetical protein
MNMEAVLRDEDDMQPIVRWYPGAGPLRSVSSEPVAVVIGLVAAAALVAGAVILVRRALNPELKALKVDKLIVRKITTLENAARYQ